MLFFKKDVYLFTTENIAGYINEMNLKDKSVLTLGSSLDQAYNALLLGADKVTVYDINVNVELFHQIKRDLILRCPRGQLYNNIIISGFLSDDEQLIDSSSVYRNNLYLQNDENYYLLREKLLEKEISFINGNIFDIKDELNDKIYDRMILSNVLQYLEMFSHNKDNFKVLKKMFNALKDHLSDDGIIQLLYYYNTGLIGGYKDYYNGYNLDKILETLQLKDDDYKMLEFSNNYNVTDGAVLYKKR